MGDQAPQDLIARWRAGDEQALKDLLPLVYEELRRVARKDLRGQRANHTLQTTALIHEAYLRLARAEGAVCVTLSEASDVADRSEVDVLAVDEALTRLSELDQQQARVVELRFFGGLSIQETADALNISPSTVKREWTMARSWLSRELQRMESL
jgi:DNA-binding NarL/FixJ family response regulator